MWKKILMVVGGGILLGVIGYFVFFSGKAQPQTTQTQPTVVATPTITATAILTPTLAITAKPTEAPTTKPTAAPTESESTRTPTISSTPTL